MSEQREDAGALEKKREHVLISVSNPQTADQLVRLACLVTDTSSVLHVMNVTLQAPFPKRAAAWRRSSQLVMDMTHLAHRLGRVARPLATTARSIPDAIVAATEDAGADLIIMGWFGRVTPLAVKKSRVVNKVLHKAECDIAVLKSRGEMSEVERLVVPVGREMGEGRLALVNAFLWRWPVETVLVRVLTADSELEEQDARDLLERTKEQLGKGAEVRVVRAPSVVDGILSVTEENDLLVVGPGREWVFSSFLFGRHSDQLTNRAPCSVLMFKSREQILAAWFRGLCKALVRRLTRRTE
jgi:nucleotide-binding universal stress UspA family protein